MSSRRRGAAADRDTAPLVEPKLICFAAALSQRIGAERVLLFGSRATGMQQPDSNDDIITVAESFRDVEWYDRGKDIRGIWYGRGGEGPIDIICVTSEEFEDARNRITLIAAVLPEAIDLLDPAHQSAAIAEG